jgi:hypothetical protein
MYTKVKIIIFEVIDALIHSECTGYKQWIVFFVVLFIF